MARVSIRNAHLVLTKHSEHIPHGGKRALFECGMTVNRCWPVVALALLLVQDGTAADEKRADPDTSRGKTRIAAKPALRSDAATGNSELYGGITIRPGKAYVIDSKLDYSALERVAVSIRLDPQSAADLSSLALQ